MGVCVCVCAAAPPLPALWAHLCGRSLLETRPASSAKLRPGSKSAPIGRPLQLASCELQAAPCRSPNWSPRTGGKLFNGCQRPKVAPPTGARRPLSGAIKHPQGCGSAGAALTELARSQPKTVWRTHASHSPAGGRPHQARRRLTRPLYKERHSLARSLQSWPLLRAGQTPLRPPAAPSQTSRSARRRVLCSPAARRAEQQRPINNGRPILRLARSSGAAAGGAQP